MNINIIFIDIHDILIRSYDKYNNTNIIRKNCEHIYCINKC